IIRLFWYRHCNHPSDSWPTPSHNSRPQPPSPKQVNSCSMPLPRSPNRRLRQDLEQTSQDLIETQEVLRRKQALAEMSAMLAHEIRNPLGSMELLTALLSE